MKYLLNTVLVIGLCWTGIQSSAAYAKNSMDNCQALQLYVTNASQSEVHLLNDEASVDHGSVIKRGITSLKPGQTGLWVMSEAEGYGPRGNITYSWVDNGDTKFCTIHYRKSACGYLFSGYSSTYVTGSCASKNAVAMSGSASRTDIVLH